MKAYIEGQEHYPVWVILDQGSLEDHGFLSAMRAYEVPEELVAREHAAVIEFGNVQRELRKIIDPPCPTCGHPATRHQVDTRGDWHDKGETYCLHRDHHPDGRDMPRCACTTPQPTNPNLIEK